MTRTLYVDCATTGRFLYREPNKDPRQPHLCRLALLHDRAADGRRYAVRLIRPMPGWRFDPDAIAGHNVTREDAVQRGSSPLEAMQTFDAMLADSDEIVAFNWEFHARVLAKAMADLGDTLVIPPRIKQTCAMRAATPVVRKQVEGRLGYAWPKQAEAYRYFGAGAELPPLDSDPIERGRALVDSVRTIHLGTLERVASRVS